MAPPRLCPHCGQVTRGRCTRCRRERYGAAHQAERKRWEPRVTTGTVPCWRDPSHLIAADEPWHLDHTPDGYQPSCARHNDEYSGR